jgi:hypothetical protein
LTGGDYYNVYRWYQSGIGRYERVDPLFSGHPYAYVGQAPLAYSDPLGLVRVTQSFSQHFFLGWGGQYNLAYNTWSADGGCVCEDGSYYVRLSLSYEHRYRCSGRSACLTEQHHAELAYPYIVVLAQRWNPAERVPYGTEQACQVAADAAAADLEANLFNNATEILQLHHQDQQWFEDTHHGWPCGAFPNLCGRR